MLNHIVIMGRLVEDPELRRTQSEVPVVNFRVACERDYKADGAETRDVDFINCVAWRSTAEFVSKWFTKGQMAVVSGRLQMQDWTDKDGNKRITAEIKADNVYFGSSKADSGDKPNGGARTGQGSQNAGGGAYRAAGHGVDVPRPGDNDGGGFSELTDADGELPF